ncbi:ABC transporter permease [Plantactinospora sp. KLBMP9567]|uniref:ABC transporter permease n=1 Tax=Plantactinospora sp. KLBMP9567 TaxID=3085900 RepID=UPI002981B7E4|nr:ABC transporter permease [Plantactinospora sp. KLBMP9567]MDW5330510.1 ABC transporter permease [Plantactinospora sp. KLBMP9567]
MNRVLTVTRVQLVGWQNTVGWPWLLLVMIFAVNYGIFLAIGDIDESPTTGALMSIYIVVFVTSINWITQLLPFSMALSVIRRTFYLATALFLVVQSVAFGVLLFLCQLLENATGGWGINLRFFGLNFIDQQNPLLQIAIYTMPFILLGFLGIFVAVFYKRFGLTGMWLLSTATLLVLASLAVLLTWLDLWSGIGGWLTDQPMAAWFVGWPALLAALLAGAGYLTIRRVTP